MSWGGEEDWLLRDFRGGNLTSTWLSNRSLKYCNHLSSRTNHSRTTHHWHYAGRPSSPPCPPRPRIRASASAPHKSPSTAAAPERTRQQINDLKYSGEVERFLLDAAEQHPDVRERLEAAWEAGRAVREAQREKEAARSQKWTTRGDKMEDKRWAKKASVAQGKVDAKATVEGERRERREAADARGDVGDGSGTVLDTAVPRLSESGIACEPITTPSAEGPGSDDSDEDDDDDGETGINMNELDELEFREAMADMRSGPKWGEGAPKWYERELVEDYDKGIADDAAALLPSPFSS